MKIFQKILFFLLPVVFVLGVLWFIGGKKESLSLLSPVVLAEEDEEDKEDEEEKEEDEKDEEDEKKEDEEQEEDEKKTETKIVLETKIYQETKSTVFKDSDGDGLLDENDPHPDIAEIYIVEDANGNGIVDKFER